MAEMLGTLDFFSAEFPDFSAPISAKLVDVLRTKPTLLRKAYRSASHVLSPEEVADASAATQSLAGALLQALNKTFEAWVEEDEPLLQQMATGDELEDDNASCVVQ